MKFIVPYYSYRVNIGFKKNLHFSIEPVGFVLKRPSHKLNRCFVVPVCKKEVSFYQKEGAFHPQDASRRTNAGYPVPGTAEGMEVPSLPSKKR